jgi:alkyl hydroperoxide reductase subunit AhpC
MYDLDFELNFKLICYYYLVCPANWKPGKRTINPDVSKSKEYFEHMN